jgi:hypothetical protein
VATKTKGGKPIDEAGGRSSEIIGGKITNAKENENKSVKKTGDKTTAAKKYFYRKIQPYPYYSGRGSVYGCHPFCAECLYPIFNGPQRNAII